MRLHCILEARESGLLVEFWCYYWFFWSLSTFFSSKRRQKIFRVVLLRWESSSTSRLISGYECSPKTTLFPQEGDLPEMRLWTIQDVFYYFLRFKQSAGNSGII